MNGSTSNLNAKEHGIDTSSSLFRLTSHVPSLDSRSRTPVSKGHRALSQLGPSSLNAMSAIAGYESASEEEEEMPKGASEATMSTTILALSNEVNDGSPDGELGNFGDLFSYLASEKEKVEAKMSRVKRVETSEGEPDVLVIPTSRPLRTPMPPIETKEVQNGVMEDASANAASQDMSTLRSEIEGLKTPTDFFYSSATPPPSELITPLHPRILARKPPPAQLAKVRAQEDTLLASPAPTTPSISATSFSGTNTPHTITSLSPLSSPRATHDLPAFSSHFISADYEDYTSHAKPDTSRPTLPLPVRERATSLLSKLAFQFPAERDTFARAEALGARTAPEGLTADIMIHIDISNIFINFLDWCAEYGCYDRRNRARRRPKLDFHSLFAILERGRSAKRRILVGSRPLQQSLQLAEDWKYEIHLLDRVHRRPAHALSTDSGSADESSSDADATARAHRRRAKHSMREQAVDEVLQLKLYETVTSRASAGKVKKGGNRPVIVLATGDGARSEYTELGFAGPVRIALTAGFDVELFSFRSGLSSTWYAEQKRANRAGPSSGRLTIIELDQFGPELVTS